ncbi:MAG: NTPase [Nanoarchaeota archaeon]|nr:NTPase [Nanoarchaeota archaeon]
MNIFITGQPGCGKSSLISSLIKELKNKNIAGIVTPEIRKGKQRYGFKIIDIKTNQEEILASVDIKSQFKVSKYYVNIRGINKIIDRFLEGFDKADFIFIDEIGAMELISKEFKEALEKILNSDKTIVATLHRNLVDKYKNKGKLFYLTRENFNEIKQEILIAIKDGL